MSDVYAVDNESALAQLREDAASDAPQALFALASALVLRHQMEEAYDLHRRAAEAGHALAQIELARMLLHGVGTTVDPVAAVEWLLRAEATGQPIAGYFLALIAIGGAVMPRDGQINARVLAAVNADYPPALRAVAIHFGRKPHPDDQRRCMQLLERAASRGDAVAALLLAERLANGEGCIAEPDTAADLHAQLALQGIAPLPKLHVPDVINVPCSPGVIALEDALQPPPTRVAAQRPRVGVVDGLLSADECRLLIASAQPVLQPSRTVDPETGLPITMPIRTSSDASIDPVGEDLALRLVQLRIACAAGVELVHAEHLTVLSYEPGQQYRPHRDYVPTGSIERNRPQAGNRARTICVYLNDVEAGGETEFPVADLRIAPVPGRAIVFDNLHADGSPDVDSLHAGLPVQSGEKWLATLWLRQRPYRHF